MFKVAETAAEEEVKKMCRYHYPNMKKSMGDFKLGITEGEFTDSEIMVMLGENGETRVRGSGGGCDLSYRPLKESSSFRNWENHIHPNACRKPQTRRRR